ncbi:Calx-beta domain-containing protein [Maribacter sp. 4G9]|uniref:Calx-beta domain-containing protein n=1 Tax=Maribacter sp. 4G9 TaxID=1889777 RepID=UPI000C161636|nr:Calx-beta domain-containing protein [Maribacter sp. 4G9]PIB29820.1 hypothetical protein BFP75_02940 [Maribacter sp. 4G9]
MTGTLNFSGAAGQTVNIPIDITDDAIIEGTENLTVTINSVSNPLVNIVDGDAIGTITDNDGGSGLGISVADFTVDESVGTANFVVSSNVAVAGAYTVNYTISNGSAVRNQDFTVPAMTGTLNFSGAAGQTVNIPIDITDDAIIEGTENLTVTINSVSNPLVNIVEWRRNRYHYR